MSPLNHRSPILRLLTTSSLAVGLLVLPLASMPRCAHARVEPATEPEPEPELDGKAFARQRVSQGQALYEQARYEEALVAFQDAAAAYASPDFQFNIGLCHERLGEPQAAIRAFEAYLRNKPDASDRASVEHRIAQLRAELEAPAEPPPPAVSPSPQQPTAPQLDQPPPAEAKPHRPLVITGSVLLGVGVGVAAGGGVTFGVLANRRAARVDDTLTLDNPEELTREEARALATEGDRFRTLQITSLASGGALAIAGAVVLAKGLQRRRLAGRVSVLPSPRGVALWGRF